VSTGQEERGSPVQIRASVPGTGNGSAGGVLYFDAKWENQRPALLLLDGVVYIGFGAFGDNGPWHGWLLAYDENTLEQLSVYCDSPNGVGGGIWMSGAGIAADTDNPTAYPSGRMFVATGNGDFNATSAGEPGADFGDSVLNLSLQKGALTVGDFFTPSDDAYLDAADGDLGSGGALVIPDAASTTPLLIQAGKEGKIYLLNRNDLGSFHGTDQVVQELANGQTSSDWGAGLWGLPAYWNNTVYFPGRNSPLQAFSLTGGLLSTTPVSETTEILSYPGPSPSISSNGNSDGIVWLLESIHPQIKNAVLEAYQATNLQNLLYSSQTNVARDGLNSGVKFSVPTIANGKVYAVDTVTDSVTNAVYGELNVFALLSGVVTAQPPVFDPVAGRIATPASVKITDTTAGAAIHYTTDGSLPTAVSPLYTGPITVNNNETITAIASAAGFLQSPPVASIYTSTSQVYNPLVAPIPGFYSNSVTVSIRDPFPNAPIYYTLDGSIPTQSSKLYTGSFVIKPAVTSNITLNVIALSPTGVTPVLRPSEVITEQYEIAGPACTMTRNGSSPMQQQNDTRLEMTTGGDNQAGSAFYNLPVNVAAFQTDFSFELSNPASQGFTFTLQGNVLDAVGSDGGGLGYAGMKNSIALFFDFYQTNSIGVVVNGATPPVPGATPVEGVIAVPPSVINLSSGDTMLADVVFYSTTLAVTLTDTVTGISWATSFQLDILTQTATGTVGGSSAYAGFTASTNATGGSSQKILWWTYEAGAPATAETAIPVFSPVAGSFTTPQKVTITDATAGAKIYYTTDGSQPTTSSSVYSGPIAVASTEKVQAIAQAPNPQAPTAGQPANLIVSPLIGGVYTIGTGEAKVAAKQ
jgi:hypothetical protein